MYRQWGLDDEAMFMARWAEEELGQYPITRYTEVKWPETYRQPINKLATIRDDENEN